MKLYQEAEKFITENYYKDSHDSRSKLNIPALVEVKLKEDNRNKDVDYYGHREGVVHVSSLSKCLRGVVHHMLGAKPDKEIEGRILGVFKAGNLFEDFIIDCLGSRVVHKQREYNFKYKNLQLVGRSDYTIDDDGIMRIGENKSVNSDSFWYREKEGTLVAWNNQIQIQVYMWLERMLFNNQWEGVFSYISKDDCTVVGAPIKFNQKIIDEVVIPALDIINEAYTAKNPNLAPLPDKVIWNTAKEQYQKNWLCTYCEYHNQCDSPNWLVDATADVSMKNKQHKASLKPEMTAHLEKKEKKIITVKE